MQPYRLLYFWWCLQLKFDSFIGETGMKESARTVAVVVKEGTGGVQREVERHQQQRSNWSKARRGRTQVARR